MEYNLRTIYATASLHVVRPPTNLSSMKYVLWQSNVRDDFQIFWHFDRILHAYKYSWQFALRLRRRLPSQVSAEIERSGKWNRTFGRSTVTRSLALSASDHVETASLSAGLPSTFDLPLQYTMEW